MGHLTIVYSYTVIIYITLFPRVNLPFSPLFLSRVGEFTVTEPWMKERAEQTNSYYDYETVTSTFVVGVLAFPFFTLWVSLVFFLLLPSVLSLLSVSRRRFAWRNCSRERGWNRSDAREEASKLAGWLAGWQGKQDRPMRTPPSHRRDPRSSKQKINSRNLYTNFYPVNIHRAHRNL